MIWKKLTNYCHKSSKMSRKIYIEIFENTEKIFVSCINTIYCINNVNLINLSRKFRAIIVLQVLIKLLKNLIFKIVNK